MFPADRAFLVVDLDADVVQVGMSMDRRPGIGLGQDQPVLGAGQPPHFVAKFDDVTTALLAREQSQAAVEIGLQEYFLAAIE